MRGAYLCVVGLQVHHVSVKGGPNGYSDFVRDIQSIFGITTEHDMQLAFDCADPITGARSTSQVPRPKCNVPYILGSMHAADSPHRAAAPKCLYENSALHLSVYVLGGKYIYRVTMETPVSGCGHRYR